MTEGRLRNLRILHLNTYDVTGGAALATYKLHRGLCKLGYDSSMLVAHRKSSDPTVSAFAPKRDLPSRLSRRLRHETIKFAFSRYKQTRPAGLERFTDDRSLYGSQLPRQLPECDIINLHWVAGFLDYRHFFAGVPHHIPIFWRLSDMNAFTGGCHFDVGCAKHESGCGACPQLGSASEEDLSRDIWKRKESAFRAVRPERLHVVALNRWMAERVRRSPLLGRFGVTVIPNGVETDVFAPRDKHFARDVFGIPQDANVLLFAADSVTNRRKGFHVLTEALNTLPDSSNIALVSVGAGNVKLGHGIPHIHVGHVEDRQRLGLVYSAADVYVAPSLQDNQPNTVLESMACGTPVVGFDVGGIPDMVRPGITGLLAPVGDAGGLRAAILQIFEHRETRASLGAACRRIVMEEYTMDRQVRQYAELYLNAFQQAVPRSR